MSHHVRRYGWPGLAAQDAPHVCRTCRLPLVQPEALTAEGPAWRVFLRCPSCRTTTEELLDAAALERLDDQLDNGTQQLIEALARMTELNMREYADRFAAALAADAITPGDF